MVCNEYKVIEEKNGKTYIKGTIYADTMPSTMPTNGADVDGLSDDKEFAVGMSLFAPNGTKVLFPNGWQEV